MPAGAVSYGESNVLAVQAKDFGGLGGLLGQPHVGVALPGKWKCRFRPGTGDAEEMASADLDDSDWTVISLPDTAWDARQRKDPSWGWYRYSFDLSSDLSRRDLLVDLGRLYDAAECYLNGKPVGRMGRFPPEEFLQTAGRLRLVLPAGRLKEGRNVLAVQVYNQSEFGGLVGIPTVALDDEVLLGQTASVAALLERSGDLPAGRLLDLCEYLVHSGRASEVARMCGELLDSAGTDAPTRHRARSLRVYGLWLEGRAAEAWEEFEKLDFTRPVPYHAAAVASRLHPSRGSAHKGLIYAGRDTELQGDWDFRYGLEEAVLCAMGAPFDFVHGTGPGLSYDFEVASDEEVARAWLGARTTSDPRALYCPLTDGRRYASWDDRGEARPFDDRGPDMLVSVGVPAGPHLLSLYLVDWDWHEGPHPRMQTVTVLDEDKAPLAVVGTGKFGGGQYERFLVRGPVNLTLRITKHRSPCAVLSGLFLDEIAPLQEPPGQTAAPAEEVRALAGRYDELTAASQESLLKLVEGEELAKFERDCRALLDGPAEPRMLWYLAECSRVRADYAGSQEMLLKFLRAARNRAPGGSRGAVMRRIRRTLTRGGYRPEAVMAAYQAVASTVRDGEARRFRALASDARIGHIRRIKGRWAAKYNLTTD